MSSLCEVACHLLRESDMPQSFDLATKIQELRAVKTDTQDCEVKESIGKIPNTLTDTLSAFANGSGGWVILGLSEKNGFLPAQGFDAETKDILLIHPWQMLPSGLIILLTVAAFNFLGDALRDALDSRYTSGDKLYSPF